MAGIPQYFILNLQNSTVTEFKDPNPSTGTYRRTSAIDASGTLLLQFCGPDRSDVFQIQAAQLLS